MVNQFTMPLSLAANQDDFRRLFCIKVNKATKQLEVKAPNYDWTRVEGFAYPHILLHELDELILATPGMKSQEITDAKKELAKVIASYIEVDCKTLPAANAKGGDGPEIGFIYRLKVEPPIEGWNPIIVRKYWDGSQYLDFNGALNDVAYSIIERMYVPTVEEYDCIFEKEFGSGEESDAPIIRGVYDSIKVGHIPFPKAPGVDELDNAHFYFCKEKWDEFHDSNGMIGESNEEADKVIRRLRKTIEDEWLKLTPEQQLGWVRG